MKILTTILVAAFIGMFSSGVLSFVADAFRKKTYYMKIKETLGLMLLCFTFILVCSFAAIVAIWIVNYFR